MPRVNLRVLGVLRERAAAANALIAGIYQAADRVRVRSVISRQLRIYFDQRAGAKGPELHQLGLPRRAECDQVAGRHGGLE